MWTDAEIETIKINYQRQTDETIAKLLHRGTSQVKKKRQRLGLKKPNRGVRMRGRK
jgi:hypothetical protein